ncbi:HNH endonuclease [Methylocella sp.]|uniref:HNH endonuclease n=1 Tax=Methylocella sp. TaxID=1978226 RepID=UPI0035B3A3CC
MQPAHRPTPREQRRDADRLRGSAHERGYDARWRKARLVFLAAHPLCAWCEAKGRVTAASVVHHRVAHRGDAALFWDEANWEALCAPCHDVDAQREEARGVRKPWGQHARDRHPNTEENPAKSSEIFF